MQPVLRPWGTLLCVNSGFEGRAFSREGSQPSPPPTLPLLPLPPSTPTTCVSPIPPSRYPLFPFCFIDSGAHVGSISDILRVPQGSLSSPSVSHPGQCIDLSRNTSLPAVLSLLAALLSSRKKRRAARGSLTPPPAAVQA